jgi:N-acetylglucosamine-6-phosphate deacetylase
MRLGVAGALVDGVRRVGDVEVDAHSGRIIAIGVTGPGRGLAVPGLVDLQVNGFAGVDFLTAESTTTRASATPWPGPVSSPTNQP